MERYVQLRTGRGYVQVRYVCRKCGEYPYIYHSQPRQPEKKCHHCGENGLICLSVIHGRSTCSMAYGVGRPNMKLWKQLRLWYEYVQFRAYCKKCGEYNVVLPQADIGEKTVCFWCGKEQPNYVICKGETTREVDFGPTKPHRRPVDWVRGSPNARKSGKSTGRPKKKPLNNTPYTYTVVDVVEDE